MILGDDLESIGAEALLHHVVPVRFTLNELAVITLALKAWGTLTPVFVGTQLAPVNGALQMHKHLEGYLKALRIAAEEEENAGESSVGSTLVDDSGQRIQSTKNGGSAVGGAGTEDSEEAGGTGGNVRQGDGTPTERGDTGGDK